MINDLGALKLKLKSIIKKFLENDIKLIQKDAHKLALAFRFGLYLAEQFKNWDIDMEYNKRGNQKKRIMRGNKTRLFRPDLIVHKRTNDINNLVNNYIILQIKKNTSYELDSPQVNDDRESLKELTLNNGDYRYKLGILLYFYCKQDSTNYPYIEYYRNGELIEREG